LFDLDNTSSRIFCSFLDFDETSREYRAGFSQRLSNSKCRRAEFSKLSRPRHDLERIISSCLDFVVTSNRVFYSFLDLDLTSSHIFLNCPSFPELSRLRSDIEPTLLEFTDLKMTSSRAFSSSHGVELSFLKFSRRRNDFEPSFLQLSRPRHDFELSFL
jgi:hypothetical protein